MNHATIRRAREIEARTNRILNAMRSLEDEGLAFGGVLYADQIAHRAGLDPKGMGAIMTELARKKYVTREHQAAMRCFVYRRAS